MPLVTLCGLPAAGKTTFAEGLVAFLEKELPGQQGRAREEEGGGGGAMVVLINEEALHIQKKEGYKDATSEKVTRGGLKSRVDHALNRETVVVLDSMNYIKGFRYQLYCMARAETTQHCVVWIEASDKAVAQAWNEGREDGYPPELFNDLCCRFEAPNESNRWDRPLIRFIPPSPPSSSSHRSPPPAGVGEGGSKEDKEGERWVLAYRQVLQALTEGKAPAAGLSTAMAPRNEADALYLLDQATQRLLATLLDRQKTSLPGDSLTLPQANLPVRLARHVSLPELKRLRRQFVKQAAEWAAATLGADEGGEGGEEGGGKGGRREMRVGDAFVEYINMHTS
ncbi:protein kti12 homolog [Nannochloropsis oceanica]